MTKEKRIDRMAQLRTLIFVITFMGVAPAFAGQSLADSIRQDPACRQYNDGCSICLIVDGHAQCSTPTIACTVTGWVCVDHVSPASDTPPDPKAVAK